MTETGYTRRRRTQRLDVVDPAGNVHQLQVWVTEHECEKPNGFTTWRKRKVDCQLSNGRSAIGVTYDTFRDTADGTIYTAVR